MSNDQTLCVNEFRITGRIVSVNAKAYGSGKTMQIAKIETARPSREGPTDCLIELACFGFAAEKAKENVGSVVTVSGYIETNERGFLNMRTMQFMVNDPAVFDESARPTMSDDDDVKYHDEWVARGGKPLSEEDEIPF